MKDVAKGKASCADVYATHAEGYEGEYMKGLIKSVSHSTSPYILTALLNPNASNRSANSQRLQSFYESPAP